MKNLNISEIFKTPNFRAIQQNRDHTNIKQFTNNINREAKYFGFFNYSKHCFSCPCYLLVNCLFERTIVIEQNSQVYILFNYLNFIRTQMEFGIFTHLTPCNYNNFCVSRIYFKTPFLQYSDSPLRATWRSSAVSARIMVSSAYNKTYSRINVSSSFWVSSSNFLILEKYPSWIHQSHSNISQRVQGINFHLDEPPYHMRKIGKFVTAFDTWLSILIHIMNDLKDFTIYPIL